jgi:hypothetical protein
MKNQETIIYTAREMKIRNFTKNKIVLYLYHIDSFLNFAAYPIDELTDLDVKNYLSYLYKNDKPERFCRSALSACRFFYKMLGKDFDIPVKNNKKSKKQAVIRKISRPMAIELLCC